MKEAKVGDVVWYVVGQERQKAKVLSLNGSTDVHIRILTGNQTGLELDAPWGIVELCVLEK